MDHELLPMSYRFFVTARHHIVSRRECFTEKRGIFFNVAYTS